MKLFLGADHNGFQYKELLERILRDEGYEVHDDGGQTLDPQDDFPVFAARVAVDVLGHENARGILLCGSGQGMCMAANRFIGVRAVLGYDDASVRSARNDDDANVLCLPASSLTEAELRHLVKLFLETPFAGARRFVRRIQELDTLHG